jgi:hypothetical protein
MLSSASRQILLALTIKQKSESVYNYKMRLKPKQEIDDFK